ncbi:MAG: transcriptional regulator [Nitrospirae bacterium CG18_big_fil_WC_8_21_14_2_50_70_55]|nr:transcriptional regulator [Deltaproteobacteria bacterium]OIP63392.1 MAG: transcriptional regulator [Nitrospirae bacterium CG2_30_70_394]PIQ05884.1 MAG: transcriptional regulator [Nitrospirae bacterium CG18_big_fil_WC_8_21_14_2_50_70_55]PIW82080.1 MAG: transcriptional regulator [Nitrospirae bacterium CG_4_8_14_3_um_filter_70_85]PIX83741.1 MAG: transcriptional regulator [Nitrospirae bacterium CG_4_10_14_3_um_filter_70_108]PJB96812.1 MAG: transcriptional regulator [Nitrospirae bacterium CG_4_9
MYDSPEELLRKIRLGEDTSLETKAVYFKGSRVDGPRRDELADTICGMANTAEGVLVLGVDDKTKEILGLPLERLEEVERFIFEICQDSIKPPVVFRTLRMELSDSTGTLRPILKVEIPRSLFIHQSPGGYFHRQGSSTRQLPTDLLLRLGQQRSQARLLRFDEQVVPESGLADLDEPLWRRFLSSFSGEPVARLQKSSLLTKDDAGQVRASVAGVLMCSRSPEQWLPGAFIQAVRYRGTRQDSNYQTDARELTGPLDEQLRTALAFVRRNMAVAARKDPARTELPQFSLRAVFEAVVNALAHRDYSIHGSKIRLFMFDDRLELYSPGPLPNTVTIDSLALRQSTRNELITTLLAKCPVDDPAGAPGRRFLMEKRGDGVPIILEESRKLCGRLPVYRLIDDAELLLTIWAAAADEQPRDD